MAGFFFWVLDNPFSNSKQLTTPPKTLRPRLVISRLKTLEFSATFRTVGSSQVGESRASDRGTKTVRVVQKNSTYGTIFFAKWYKNGSRDTKIFIVCNICVQHFSSVYPTFISAHVTFLKMLSFCIISLRYVQHFSSVYPTFLPNLSNIMGRRV